MELPPLVGATVRFGLNLEPVAADRNEDIAAKLGDLVADFPHDVGSVRTPAIKGPTTGTGCTSGNYRSRLVVSLDNPQKLAPRTNGWAVPLPDHRPSRSQLHSASADDDQQTDGEHSKRRPFPHALQPSVDCDRGSIKYRGVSSAVLSKKWIQC